MLGDFMEEMKQVERASFFTRGCAYCVDFLVIYFFISLISLMIPTSQRYDELIDERDELIASLEVNGSISVDNYVKEMSEINYDISKELIAINAVNVALTFVYYGVCAYLTGGRTVGKYVMHIRVKSQNGELTWKQMLLRPLLINSVLANFIVLILLFLMKSNKYALASEIIAIIDMLFVVISGFMILYSKKRLGLHDKILGTEVIKEEK